MANQQVSSALEDYLKVIWGMHEWGIEQVTVKALAERMGYAPSSVSEAIKKMTAAGLVKHEKYRGITLSEEGTNIAVGMVRRHRIIETFLVEYADYSWDEVHEEAEVLEHAVSDRLIDAIWVKLGKPERDPHGDPIPDAAGVLPQGKVVALTDLAVGEQARIVQISDRSSELLQFCEANGLLPGAIVKVTALRPVLGMMSMELTELAPVNSGFEEIAEVAVGRQIELGTVAAEALRVQVLA